MLDACLTRPLQDAIASVAEMAYLPEERRFVLVVSRFRWELLMKKDGIEPACERIACAVAIEDVIATLSTDKECPETMRTYSIKLQQKYLVLSDTSA